MGHDLCPTPPARRPIHRNPAAATIRQSNSPPTDPRGRPGQEPARAPPPGVAGEPAHFYLKKRGEAKHNKPAPSAARQPRPTRSPSLWTAAGDGPASPLPADLRQRVALSPARRRALVCARGEGVALPLSPAPSRKRLRLAAEARREGGEADVRALGAPRRPHSPLLPAPAVAAAQKMAAKTQGGIRLSAVSASARGPVAAEGSLRGRVALTEGGGGGGGGGDGGGGANRGGCAGPRRLREAPAERLWEEEAGDWTAAAVP